MSIPKFSTKYLDVGKGFIIGRNNIEEFFNHVNRLRDFDEKTVVELAHNYETGVASLVGMIEARFVNLNPILQQMFLKLNNMERGKEKNFVLKTLLLEFNDIAIEARKVFAHYKLLGYELGIDHTFRTLDTKRMKYEGKTKCEKEINIPIPFKLLAISDALEENFGWIVPENPFDENSKPKRKEKGESGPCVSKIQGLYDEFEFLKLNYNTCYILHA